jgi:hypothetical protein
MKANQHIKTNDSALLNTFELLQNKVYICNDEAQIASCAWSVVAMARQTPVATFKVVFLNSGM